MKTLIRLGLAALVVVGVSLPATAQVLAIDTTTATSAVTSVTAGTVNLNAVTCTGCTFGQDTLLFWTTGEAMRVTGNYVSGSGVKVVNVRRGTDGTMATTHANSERIYYGPASRFHIVIPGGPPTLGDPRGRCVRGQAGGLDRGATILPWINVLSGTLWNCDGSNNWVGTNAARVTYNSTLAAGTQ